MSNMNGIQLNTDFSQIAPNLPGGQQFPVTTDKLGWLVHITESGPRETKKKDGMLAVLKLEILDGPHKGLIGEHTINIANPNQDAVRIGMSEMSSIAHVTGTLRVGNTQELHRKPFRILVRQQAAPNDKYTEVYGVLDANGNEPGKAGQGPLQAGQPGGFGGQQQGQGQQGGGFGPGQGQQPAGGFQPNQGQQGQGGGQNWQPNGGQQAGPGWGGPGGQQQQPDPNQQQGQQGGAPGWSGGQQQGNGAPGWANNG